MKRILAAVLALCLLLCGCDLLKPEETGSGGLSLKGAADKFGANATDAAPDATTDVATEPAPKPTQPKPDKVTVYLLAESAMMDVGHSEFIYDENHNISKCVSYDLDSQTLYSIDFVEKDANGMAKMLWETWNDGSGNVMVVTYGSDGRWQEGKYDEGSFTGTQCSYDDNGRLTEMREYADGVLQSTEYREYKDGVLFRLWCETPQGDHLYDCRVENGVILEKAVNGPYGAYSYFYAHDDQGNLIEEVFSEAGESFVRETHKYKAVEVSYERAQYLLKQQEQLRNIVFRYLGRD